MGNPFRIIADFESALCDYAGSRFAVAVSSCTAALFLSLAWWRREHGAQVVEIPARTYVSVPMAAIQAGHRVRFVDREWVGMYDLAPTTVIDAAPMLAPGMADVFTVCVSFHPKKPLALANGGGAILHNDPAADEWFRRMRHDGRTDGMSMADDPVAELGWHFPMFPATAAEGLQRLSVYKPGPVVMDDYRDMRTVPVFMTGGAAADKVVP